jgi:LuxR family maltose regulon positive regulatory protein
VRSRLLERLDDVLEAGVGLVVSGPGYGKSTLIASWAESVRRVVDPAWLELRAEHEDPALLAEHLRLALRSLLPEARGGPTSIFSSLVHAAIDRTRPIVLVLDDVHALPAGATWRVLGELLDSRPTNLLVVLAGREEPPGPWARLRERRELVELGPHDLAFDRLESRRLLDLLLPTPLSAARVDELHERSGGWAAALCLASYALQRSDDSTEGPTAEQVARRYTREYVEAEVLADLEPDLLALLERVSIADTIDPDAIALLTNRPDAAEALADLARRNRLVETISDAPPVFRLHPVLRDGLRERLRLADPDAWRSLHVLASQWHEARGYADGAIALALAGDAQDRAVTLIRRACGSAIRDGYAATVSRWLDALPEASVSRDPALCLVRGRVRGLLGDVEGAAAALEEARQAIDDDRAPDPDLRIGLHQLEAGLDFWTGAITSARQRLERLLREYDDAPRGEIVKMLAIDRDALEVNLATMLVLDGDMAAALGLLARHTHGRPRRGLTRLGLLAYGLEALALALDGRDDEARRAIARGRRALELYEAQSTEPFALHLASAWLADGPSASRGLQDAAQIADRARLPVLRALVDLAVLRVALREQAPAFAAEAAHNARAAVAALPQPAFLSDLVEALTRELHDVEVGHGGRLLSAAELSVLRAISTGASRREAARALHLSHDTVKTHLRSAFRKLGVHRREDALARARALGLIEHDDGSEVT